MKASACNSGFQPGVATPECCEPYLEGSRVDILCKQLYPICLIRVLDGGRCVTLGCYDGSQYKKG